MTTLLDCFTIDEINSAREQDWDAMPHHPMGPSSLYRADKCPASVIGGVICHRAETGSEDATAGTRRHALIEAAINGNELAHDVDADDVAHVEMAKRTLEQACDKIVANGGIIAYMTTERKLAIPGLIHGTADVTMIDVANDLAFVIDWKTGYAAEACDASTQRQLQAYAVMLSYMHPTLQAVFTAACYTETGTIASAMPLQSLGLANVRYEIEAIRARAIATDAPFAETTGDYCKYCRVAAAGRCPVVRAQAVTAMACQSPAIAEEIDHDCDVATVDGADEFLDRLRRVEEYLKPLEKAAKATIIAAGGSDQYVVVPSKGRETVDTKKAKAALGDALDPYIKTGEPSVSVCRRKK
jgi:hypothetical protein